MASYKRKRISRINWENLQLKMQVLKPGNEVRGWIGAERVDLETTRGGGQWT